MSGDAVTCEGVVLDFQHDFAMVEVQLGGQTKRVLAKRCGKMARSRVFVIRGDRVRLEVSPYDLTRGRIVYRFTPGQNP